MVNRVEYWENSGMDNKITMVYRCLNVTRFKLKKIYFFLHFKHSHWRKKVGSCSENSHLSVISRTPGLHSRTHADEGALLDIIKINV